MTDDLIKRLEQAQGPDRELDREIALSCVPNARPYENDPHWIRVPSEMERDQDQLVMPFCYTASIDAALTLVPEGWAADVTAYDGGLGDARLWSDNVPPNSFVSTRPYTSRPATPAIALCIAALRARAAIATKTETTIK